VEIGADYVTGQTGQQSPTELYTSHQNIKVDMAADSAADGVELGGSRGLLGGVSYEKSSMIIESCGHGEAAVMDMSKDEDGNEDDAAELELALIQKAQRGRVVCQRCSQLRCDGRAPSL
jgi:hypothetical protein